MNLKLSLLMLGLVSLFPVIPAHADSVYVTMWQIVFNQNQGSQTYWTFGPGLQGPAPIDPNAQDFAYYGFQQPFTVEDYLAGGVNTYYGFYGELSPAPISTVFTTNTFAGYVPLTDENSFVKGLPFECTGACTNVIYRPNSGVAELAWLNSSLGPSTGANSAITGTATLTVDSPSDGSYPISGSALLTDDPTPTPGPGTLVLFGLGLFAVLAISVTKILG